MALGIAFTGAVTGIVIGEHYERRSRDALEYSMAQSKLVFRAKAGIHDASIHQRELAYLVDKPEALTNSIAGFRKKAQSFEQAFANLQAAYENVDDKHQHMSAELEVYRLLVDEYTSFAQPYFRNVEQLLQQIESLDLASDESGDQEIAQTLLLEAGTDPSLMGVHKFASVLQDLADVIDAEMVAATNALTTTATLRRNIILTSLMIAVAIAGALVFTISRSIVRPLQSVEKVAKEVTEQDRFDLQASVTTTDEVGTLAIALNQLILRVKSLLKEKEVRAQELEQANQKLVSTQKQMIVQEKLASLGSLTAGIAHEIKNPLNFVNNFAELSVDLTDELTEELKARQAQLDPEFVEEITDIIDTLNTNVGKIAHHGKRADRIVGNMLMHSRSGKSEWAEIDINDLVAEAINLAYHGIRAKQSAFNLAFDNDYDDSIGTIRACPQDLNRVFLNIANNACYAIYQRQIAEGSNFMPLLKVRTRDQVNQVEIRIRDNGTGMTPEVRDQIFDQFFTTKPTGEGTGLGLSLSYGIIVEQHQGNINVESELGIYTEFIITLPK